MVPIEDAFEHELGFTVGIDRSALDVFVNRHNRTLAISRSGGREHHVVNPGGDHRINKWMPARDIQLEKEPRVAHGHVDKGFSREVNNRLDVCLSDGFHHPQRRRADRPARGGRRDARSTVPVLETVEYDDRVTLSDQLFRNHTSDKTRPTRDKDPHRWLLGLLYPYLLRPETGRAPPIWQTCDARWKCSRDAAIANSAGGLHKSERSLSTQWQ